MQIVELDKAHVLKRLGEFEGGDVVRQVDGNQEYYIVCWERVLYDTRKLTSLANGKQVIMSSSELVIPIKGKFVRPPPC